MNSRASYYHVYPLRSVDMSIAKTKTLWMSITCQDGKAMVMTANLLKNLYVFIGGTIDRITKLMYYLPAHSPSLHNYSRMDTEYD